VIVPEFPVADTTCGDVGAKPATTTTPPSRKPTIATRIDRTNVSVEAMWPTPTLSLICGRPSRPRADQ
jgi:hypothetical protein